jgi:hypothetical protein
MGFRTGDAELAIGEVAGAYTVAWKGRASGSRPDERFTALFTRLLEADRRIELDVSGLEHISSPTLVVLMRFLKQVEARGLDLVLRYDDSVSWQRMTFEPLRRAVAGCSATLRRIPPPAAKWVPTQHAEGWS